MNITFPEHKTKSDWFSIFNSDQLVIIGANGSGKTKIGTWFEKNLNYTKRTIHRIAAQKSLSMPEKIQPTSMDAALKQFLYGNISASSSSKNNYRWGNKPDTHLLNDFPALMQLLHTEEYETLVNHKELSKNGSISAMPETSLDKVKEAWQKVLPHRELIVSAGIVNAKVAGSNSLYNASNMSDGERVMFYILGEIMCSPQNSILIFDEPELHIHKSLINKFWNIAESLRSDCFFIYLTHDLDFATGRYKADKVWLKEYDGEKWEYSYLNTKNESIPEDLLLELLGSRKEILFIEGDRSSHDAKLYEYVFPEFTIKPLGSCQKVINCTKAFNSLRSLHHMNSKGLIDRDRRTDYEVINLNRMNVFVPMVAEVENFFLLEGVVKIVAKTMLKDPDSVFNDVITNVIEFFSNELPKQVSLHASNQIRKTLTQCMSVTEKPKSVIESEYIAAIGKIDINSIFSNFEESFKELINTKNYEGILKVINHKGLLPESKVANLCGIIPSSYKNYIQSMIEEGDNNGQSIIDEIRKYIQQ